MVLSQLRTWWKSRPSSVRGKRSRRPARPPSLETLEDRRVPTVTYLGGPLLTNVQVETNYYGAQWNTDSSLIARRDQLNNFFQSITNSPYLDQLQEYSEPGYLIGRGRFTGENVLGPTLGAGSTVSDTTIRQAITANLGKVDNIGHTVPRPNANTIYFVYAPPNVNDPVNYRATGDMGFHQSVRDAAGDLIRYAVVTTLDVVQLNGRLAPLDQLTETSAHELAEGITDPDLSNGWRAWSQNGQPEIAGLCEGQPSGILNGYKVPMEWSNEQLALTGNGCALLTIPNFQSFHFLPDGEVEALDFGSRLMHRSPDGTWGLAEWNVDSVDVTNDGTRMYVLRQDGTLEFDENAVMHTLDIGVESFAITQYTRQIYEVKSGGEFFFHDDMGWQHIDGGVKSIASTPDHNVLYELKFNGDLTYYDFIGRQHYLDHAVLSFGLTGNGNVFDELTFDHVLKYHDDLGWHNAFYGVQSMELGFGGLRLYYQMFHGELYYADYGTGSHLIESGVAAFHLANGGGTLYALNDRGQLQRGIVDSLQTIDTSVMAFDTARHGTRVYEQTTGGTLRFTEGNGWVTVDTAVKSWGLVFHGTRIYEQTTGGTFGFREVPGAGVLSPRPLQLWNGDSTPAASFGLAFGGTRVYELTTGGTLYYDDGSGRHLLDRGVTSFALAFNGGRVYELTTGGLLRFNDGFGWQTFDSGVTSFALAFNGNRLYELTAAGALRFTDYNGWMVQQDSVKAFVLGGLLGTSVDTLDFSGNLRHIQGSVTSLLDSNVDAIWADPGGLTFEAHEKTGRTRQFPA
jgi:hypothetical protein